MKINSFLKEKSSLVFQCSGICRDINSQFKSMDLSYIFPRSLTAFPILFPKFFCGSSHSLLDSTYSPLDLLVSPVELSTSSFLLPAKSISSVWASRLGNLAVPRDPSAHYHQNQTHPCLPGTSHVHFHHRCPTTHQYFPGLNHLHISLVPRFWSTSCRVSLNAPRHSLLLSLTCSLGILQKPPN